MSDGLKLLKVIIANNSTEELNDIDPCVFIEGKERDAYLFTTDHYKTYSVLPDINTLEEYMGIDFPYAKEPVNYYLDRCLDRDLYSNVRKPFQDLQASMRNTDMSAVVDNCAALYSACKSARKESGIINMGDMMADLRVYSRERQLSTKLEGIATGWPSVDEETLGWQKGDLVVFVARPSIGKSNLLIHSCHHAWRSGKSVLFASMEMSLKQIGLRVAAQCAGINPTMNRKGKLCHWAQQRLTRAEEEMQGDNGFNLYGGSFQGKTTDQLDSAIQEYSPDIVYVDGLYLMSSNGAPRHAGRYEKVAYVVDDLKSSALSRDRPIVGTTQFNRTAGARGRSGDLENIGYTDTLSTHASIIISVKTPIGDTAQHPKTRILTFLKGREGETGSVLIHHTFSPLSFTEVVETSHEKEAREIAELEAEAEASRPNRGAWNQRPQGDGSTTRHMNN